jgi:hypothetical protein
LFPADEGTTANTLGISGFAVAIGLAFSSGAIAEGMSKSEYDATGCSLLHRAARMGYTTVARPISGAAALGVPSGLTLQRNPKNDKTATTMTITPTM